MDIYYLLDRAGYPILFFEEDGHTHYLPLYDEDMYYTFMHELEIEEPLSDLDYDRIWQWIADNEGESLPLLGYGGYYEYSEPVTSDYCLSVSPRTGVPIE